MMGEYTGFKQPPEGVKRRSLEEIRIGVLESQIEQLQAKNERLKEICKEIKHFFDESVGQVLTSKQAYDAYHNSLLPDKIEQALQGSKKGSE